MTLRDELVAEVHKHATRPQAFLVNAARLEEIDFSGEHKEAQTIEGVPCIPIQQLPWVYAVRMELTGRPYLDQLQLR